MIAFKGNDGINENQQKLQNKLSLLTKILYTGKEKYSTQTFSALMIFVSAAHAALFLKSMSGAHVSAHFLKNEWRSR